MADNPTTTSVVRIYRFPALLKAMLARISAGRSEAARVWMHCRDLHHAARKDRTPWPWRDALQKSTKGQFALHSQTVQMIGHAFLANIETTLQLRKAGNQKARYPWRDKRYYPLLWPAQAVAVQGKHLILPMGRGQASIVLPLPDNFVAGGCKLVWAGVTTIGDGAYDSKRCYSAVHAAGGRHLAPPKMGAMRWDRKVPAYRQRNRHIDNIHLVGRPAWKKWAKYHRRSAVESAMHRWKWVTGERALSHAHPPEGGGRASG